MVIIFSHYGHSSYLDYTLACAKMTNPNARLIFLGDEANKHVAEKNGWEHYSYINYESVFQQRFRDVFKHVQGRQHAHIKNGKDWLRYVFERWFYIEGFLKKEGIKKFWHFDSDTMIIQSLNEHEEELSEYDFTVQCNGTCLNGLIGTQTVSEFCEHICSLFESKTYIENQQHEFNTINPRYAFTEMRAFADYKYRTSKKWLHLLFYKENKVFDDALCQDHGFNIIKLPIGKTVKQVYFKEGIAYGVRDHKEIQFVTLNLSWLPDYIFRWALKMIQFKSTGSVDRAQCPIYDRLFGIGKNIKTYLTRKIV